jgi:phosphinothricin acetyltransferase
MKMMTVRSATINDLAAITEIYNAAIHTTVATFDTTPKSIEEQKVWFESHGTKYPIVIGELDSITIGWASLSPYSDRCAYSDTAEVSVYVAENHRGKGFGRKILEEVIKLGHHGGLHVLIARIAEGNEKSIHLFETMGFTNVGVLKEVGRKFDRLLDVYMMQKILKGKA